MNNDWLSVRIDDKGAELAQITDRKTGFEFLWQADPLVWARRAPVLFPIVGKVKSNELMIGNSIYPAPQHGFARDLHFTQTSETGTEIWYELKSNHETLKAYPYEFILRLGYTLKENELTCRYEVINPGKNPMYFSIGAHPGFNLPIDGLDKYFIEFEQAETAERHLLDQGLFNGSTKPVLSSPTTISLSKALFDEDAIVLKQLNSKQLKLKQSNGSFCITLTFDGFPHMGIWTPKGNERFICLEPWCGHADPVSGHNDLSLKEGIITLIPGKVFARSYSLRFEA